MVAVTKLCAKKEMGRVLRFATVGLVATATHAGMVLLLVEGYGFAPLLANFFAFLLAVLVSFVGHYHWTFSSVNSYRTAFPRFIVIAFLGLGLSQAIMFSAVSLLSLNYRFGLIAVLMLVPGLNFLANRFWTFPCCSS